MGDVFLFKSDKSSFQESSDQIYLLMSFLSSISMRELYSNLFSFEYKVTS